MEKAILIVGKHEAGKSTLCKLMGRHGWPFIYSDVVVSFAQDSSVVFKEIGVEKWFWEVIDIIHTNKNNRCLIDIGSGFLEHPLAVSVLKALKLPTITISKTGQDLGYYCETVVHTGNRTVLDSLDYLLELVNEIEYQYARKNKTN